MTSYAKSKKTAVRSLGFRDLWLIQGVSRTLLFLNDSSSETILATDLVYTSNESQGIANYVGNNCNLLKCHFHGENFILKHATSIHILYHKNERFVKIFKFNFFVGFFLRDKITFEKTYNNKCFCSMSNLSFDINLIKKFQL